MPQTAVRATGPLQVQLPLAWRACPSVTAMLTSPGGELYPLTQHPKGGWRTMRVPADAVRGAWRLSVNAECSLAGAARTAVLAYGNALQISTETDWLLILDPTELPIAVLGALEHAPLELTVAPDPEKRFSLHGTALLVRPDTLPGAYQAIVTARAGPETVHLALPVWKPDDVTEVASNVRLTPSSMYRHSIAQHADQPVTEVLLCIERPADGALPEATIGQPGAMTRAPRWWHTRHGDCVQIAPPPNTTAWVAELRAPIGTRIDISRIVELRGAPLRVHVDERAICHRHTDCTIPIQASAATGPVRYTLATPGDFGAVTGGLRGRPRQAGIHTLSVLAQDSIGQARAAELILPVLDGLKTAITPIQMSDAGAAAIRFEPGFEGPGTAGWLTVDIDHPRPCRLRISLRSPSGHRRLLRDRCPPDSPLQSGQVQFVADDLLAGAPGDTLAGRWTLHVDDLERDGFRGVITHAALGWMNVLSTTPTRLPPAVVAEPYATRLSPLNASAMATCTPHGALPDGLIFDQATCAISGTPTATSNGGPMFVELSDPERAETHMILTEVAVFDWIEAGQAFEAVGGQPADDAVRLHSDWAADAQMLYLDLEANWLPFVTVDVCNETLCHPIKPLGGPPGYALQGWFAVPKLLDGALRRVRLQVAQGGTASVNGWMIGGREALRIQSGDLPWAPVGHEYIAHLEASDGQGDLRWQVVDGVLPEGLALRDDGALAGRVALGDVHRFIVEVQDEAGRSTTASITLRVAAAEAHHDAPQDIPDTTEFGEDFTPEDLAWFCLADAESGHSSEYCAAIEFDMRDVGVAAARLKLIWSHAAPLDTWAYLATPSGNLIPVMDGRGLTAGAFETEICNSVPAQARLAEALTGGACEAGDLGEVFAEELGVLASVATVDACCALRDDLPEAALRQALRGRCCTNLPEAFGEPGGTWRLLLIDVHAGEAGAVSAARLTLFDNNPAE